MAVIGADRGISIRPPWDSVLIWSGALLVLYILRDIFSTAFLTFLFVYLIRTLVVALARRIRPGEERPGLERWLTLGVFASIATLLWGLGTMLGPQLVLQGRLLTAHVEHLQPQAMLDHLLARTVGAYLFQKQYGGQGDPRYQAALASFTERGRTGEGAFEDFSALRARVREGFRMAYEGAELARIERQQKGRAEDGPAFREWFLEVKAPALVAEHRASYLARLSAGKGRGGAEGSGSDGLERGLGELALKDAEAKPAEREKLVAEWENARAQAEWQRFRASSERAAAFRHWFVSADGQALGVPYDLDTYLALSDAYASGKAEFTKVFQAHVGSAAEGEASARDDFRRATERDLARQWWSASPAAASLREHLQRDAAELASAAAARVAGLAHALIAVPAKVATALLLTILISFDMSSLKKGLRRIGESRCALVSEKLTPNLVAMARLIGRSFAAQGVIALFNTLMTIVLMRSLGIGNEVLLGLLVFIASFIPVLGVLLSGIPIALQALLQPDGSLALAFYALLGIGAIHAFESMVLSPRIVGKLLHLHPVLVLGVLVVGEHLFGVWGLLLGVPVAVYLIHAGLLAEPIPGIYEPNADAREREHA